jgi:hypothetical protein
MSKKDQLPQVKDPIHSAPPEVRQIIERVLELEKDRLDRNDRGVIHTDILNIVKEAVQ